MSLVKVKEFGYGLDNKTLDLTILLPKGTELDSFRIATQDDVFPGVNFTVIGKECIHGSITFATLFKRVPEEDEIEKENDYWAYRLKEDAPLVDEENNPITISRENLTFLTMTLNEEVDASYILSCECGDDNLVTVFPMCDMLPMKLAALKMFNAEKNPCEMPKGFIDRILQIKAIELALCLKDYVKAAEYWRKFYNFKVPVQKSCGCHG